jgi:UDPglucose 6-dehydrogenase
VDRVMEAVGLDPRIGGQFLSAGPGFGGSCFEKDVRAIVARAREWSIDLRLLDAVLDSNRAQTQHAVGLVRRALGRTGGRQVAILGLAFKAGTDDVRESRALPIVRALLRRGAAVRVHDPVALRNFRGALAIETPRTLARVTFAASVEEALTGADVAVIQAGWPQYRRWPRRWSGLMRHPVLVDLRRALPNAIRSRGDLTWIGLGTGSAGAG